MADNTELPRWRGINHLALITTDMDATTRFYHGVLGARLVATIGTPAFRHYFFEVGPGNTIAFFEYQHTELDRFAKPAGVPDRRAVQFDHLSLNVADGFNEADYGDRDLFADLDPVAAVRELAATGDVGSTPVTTLTHDPTDIVDPA